MHGCIMKKEHAITLDPQAAVKVAEYRATTGGGDKTAFLRLGVKGGGCSGFKYQLAFDIEKDDDYSFDSEGQKILVSAECLPYLDGSHIVWKETLMGSGFDVINPNATAACGCGSSFRVDKGASGCSEDGVPDDLTESAIY
jgi:iron-sulfur cluster assembly protein